MPAAHSLFFSVGGGGEREGLKGFLEVFMGFRSEMMEGANSNVDKEKRQRFNREEVGYESNADFITTCWEPHSIATAFRTRKPFICVRLFVVGENIDCFSSTDRKFESFWLFTVFNTISFKTNSSEKFDID
jgi:hypothetical protein